MPAPASQPDHPAQTEWLAPSALAFDHQGNLVVACERAGRVGVLDLESRSLRWSGVLGAPRGITISTATGDLFVTSGRDVRVLARFNTAINRPVQNYSGPAGARWPLLTTNGASLFICGTFKDEVVCFDVKSGRRLGVAHAEHGPCSLALSSDESVLAVASLLPVGPSTGAVVRAAVSLLQPIPLAFKTRVWLPNGSASVRGIAAHPARNLFAAVHNIARFQVPTTQVEYGWMHVSALSLVDGAKGELVASIVLDEARRGAANPWAVAWSPDGAHLCVTHAGTHELSVIDAAGLLAKLAAFKPGTLMADFGFLKEIRKRVPLPGGGPRALAVKNNVAYVAEFFSDSISMVDLEQGVVVDTIGLGGAGVRAPQEKGEQLFHDATIAHQQWQSCASCHPEGRTDGLNWDLLNDGAGNPKNTKSLLLSFETPPAMSHGVRGSAAEAVHSGLRHILFAVRPVWEEEAIGEYIRSIRPAPSPWLQDGKLSRSARRGTRIFEDARTGCAVCHPAPLFTDKKQHRLWAEPVKPLDTPTLVECWRTSPYLYNGAAVSMIEVLSRFNPGDFHGRTSHLTPAQIADLAEYVLSL